MATETNDASKDAPIEHELKLTVRDGDLRALEHVPVLAGAEAEHRHERTTYYDTPDLLAFRRGAALRVRRRGDALIQTFKTAGGQGVASSRGEWEWPLDTEQPVPALLGETARADLADRLHGRLIPIFRTDIQRVVRLVPVDGAVVEVAIDQGTIAAGARQADVAEIELELKNGHDPAALYALALEIHKHVPLELAADSKAARGYRLFTGGAAGVIKAPRVELAPDITAAEGFRDIVAGALSHLAANVALAGAGDPEGVHQVRVAARRLRAALLVFKRHLRRKRVRAFGGRLRDLGRVLGEARDWDVFVEETLAAARAGTSGADWPDELARAAENRRQDAQSRAAAALRSRKFTALVLKLSAWVEAGAHDPSVLGDAAMGGKLADVAADLLDRVEEKVLERGDHLGDLSEEELHALRKAMKKLRYDAEFFEALYGRDVVKSYRKQCEHLQELLGRYNDAHTMASLTTLLADGDDRLAAAREAGLAWAEAEREAARADLAPAWAEFRAAEPFWKPR